MADARHHRRPGRQLRAARHRREILPIGTAYAVWTGIGAVGTVICGIILLGDPTTPLRLACLGLIISEFSA